MSIRTHNYIGLIKKEWRALGGIVPLKSILSNKHLPVSGVCPVCKNGPEDVRHLLFQCVLAKRLWTDLGLIDKVNSALHIDRSGSVILEHLLVESDVPLSVMPSLNCKEVFATGCWYLWWLRRQHTHHDSCPPPFRWPGSILAIIGNYMKSIQKPETSEHKKSDRSHVVM